MSPIIRWTLWERKWSTFWWSVGIAAYIAINILVYSTISGETAQLNQALSKIPKSVQSLFTSSGSFLTPTGYLDSKIFYLILPIMLTILLVGLGHSLIANEEQSGTLELLVGRPISRARVMTAKLMAALIIVATVGVVTIVTTVICCKSAHLVVPAGRMVEATVLSILLASLFGMIAFMFSALGRRGRGLGTGLAALVFLASYVSSSLSGLAHWLTWPARFLPYHYYQTSAVLEGTYNWWRSLVLIGAVIVLLGISYISFGRRDLS